MSKMERQKRANTIPLRFNLLFVGVFILFSLLVLRLGFMQMVQGEEFKRQIEKTDDQIVSYPVPRGEIYDRNGNALVFNTPQKAVTFTPPKNPQPKDILVTAEKLSQFIRIEQQDIEKVPDWVKKEIWVLMNDDGKEKITDEEENLLKKGDLSDKEIYQLKLERITTNEMAEINGSVAFIYQKMRSAVALTPTIIKNEGVTDEEFASVSENLESLPGVATTVDWQRELGYGQVFQGVLGRMKEGLPPEKLDHFLSKGYALNDRYGSSYLEEHYEDVLSGVKRQEKIITDKTGHIVGSRVISEGQSGRDLVLTLDIAFQSEVEQIIQDELLKAIQYPRTDTLDRAFVVAMNPKTGEILALAGKRYNREEQIFEEFSHGTFTQSFEAGSAVKGATVLTGYQTGALEPGDVKYDRPLYFAGSPEPKSSAGGRELGQLNDLKALERSSNVYMWMIAIDILEGRYVPNGPLKINESKLDTIRYYFSQFGLGTLTGLGLKEEVTGQKARPIYPGNYIDIAIGQLDTYTPLQLAQYVSTIANDGYRMKPMLVKEIRSPAFDDNGAGQIFEEFQPTVLNRADMKEEWIERVQQGFWQVTHGSQGTARRYFSGEPYDVAGKTGTAQKSVDGKNAYNSTFVGYAPYNDPEIAISVIVPYAFYDKQPFDYTIAAQIAQRVFRAYFQ